jgi:hypothetical protein
MGLTGQHTLCQIAGTFRGMKKIHHLNCGSIFPLFPRGTQSILYCLLVEIDGGWLLHCGDATYPFYDD